MTEPGAAKPEEGVGGGRAASDAAARAAKPPPVAAAPEALASVILLGFERYHDRFDAITGRARRRFAERDWRRVQEDAVRRIGLYGEELDRTLETVEEALGSGEVDRDLWSSARERFEALAGPRPDAEIAFTFFNSVSRRLLDTVGVRPDVEFLGEELGPLPSPEDAQPCWSYPAEDGTAPALRRLLQGCLVAAPFADLDRAARRTADALQRQLREERGYPPEGIRALDVLPSPFYRNKGAYLVGRVRHADGSVPLLLALLHRPDGVRVDAVLTSSDEISVVFGFSRSYFHVKVHRPRAVVGFLKSILPAKRIDELYTALGYNRHGKTELYRGLRAHLRETDDVFRATEGAAGMVMRVFTLPGLNVVFKVIRDRFPPPKQITRREVREKYRLVFVRDRVGRLADAQEFEHLEFDRERFSDELLEELLAEAGETVHREGDRVVVEHLYTERRMTPLDLHLERADREDARAAILDYGQAIKDLAAANVFPGDLLLKNFGVSRHGRVIFYDYDELTLLEDCRFRRIPPARTPEQEMASEPWYHVAPEDVFPEEFPRFLGLPAEHRDAFMERHGDLFDPDFWKEMQRRNEEGDVVDFFPYPQHRRLEP